MEYRHYTITIVDQFGSTVFLNDDTVMAVSPSNAVEHLFENGLSLDQGLYKAMVLSHGTRIVIEVPFQVIF